MITDQYYRYTTLSGDTWDMIALDFYHQESYAPILIEANPQYRKVIIFKGGEIIRVPVIQRQPADTLPPWKRGATV